MSPAFIKGVADHLPNARITFDKFHVVAHASTALDQSRRLEQRRRFRASKGCAGHCSRTANGCLPKRAPTSML